MPANIQQPLAAVLSAIALFLAIVAVGLATQLAVRFVIRTIGVILTPRLASIIVNVFTFPGVVHHELSHAIAASLSGAEVTEIKFADFKNKGRLGYVTYMTRGSVLKQNIQRCVASTAPVVFGAVTLSLLALLVTSDWIRPYTPVRALVFYLMLCVLVHMRLSRTDVTTAAAGAVPCLVAATLLFVAARVDLINPAVSFLQRFLQQKT